jgi:hypothetical protein
MDIDQALVTGLDDLEKHLHLLRQDPETPLNAKLFDEVELQLTGTCAGGTVNSSQWNCAKANRVVFCCVVVYFAFLEAIPKIMSSVGETKPSNGESTSQRQTRLLTHR